MCRASALPSARFHLHLSVFLPISVVQPTASTSSQTQIHLAFSVPPIAAYFHPSPPSCHFSPLQHSLALSQVRIPPLPPLLHSSFEQRSGVARRIDEFPVTHPCDMEIYLALSYFCCVILHHSFDIPAPDLHATTIRTNPPTHPIPTHPPKLLPTSTLSSNPSSKLPSHPAAHTRHISRPRVPAPSCR